MSLIGVAGTSAVSNVHVRHKVAPTRHVEMFFLSLLVSVTQAAGTVKSEARAAVGGEELDLDVPDARGAGHARGEWNGHQSRSGGEGGGRHRPDSGAAALEDHLVLEDVSWEFYEMLLQQTQERHLRITYDEGRLELMSPLPRHERVKQIVGELQ